MEAFSYDPLTAPDPEMWLGLDEDERKILIESYHGDARIEVPNLTMHAALHAVVETQIAMGDALPIRRKMVSLLASGLDRHDAIHAIASVLATHIYDLATGSAPGPEPNDAYFKAVKRLTARRWLGQA